MVLSPVDTCGNGCGLVAALIGCLGFGSFGAPLKSEAVNKVNADPFVLQTYKSSMCFLTCWLVIPLGIEFEFTPYGIVSGVLWVTGGVCGIYGIRNAGLAISVGTWSSVTVLVSFAWGILVFDEEVQSIQKTLVGIWMMIVGFIGMAYFSSTGGGDQGKKGTNSGVAGTEEGGEEGGGSGGNLYVTESESDEGSLHLNDGDLTEGLLHNDHLQTNEEVTATNMSLVEESQQSQPQTQSEDSSQGQQDPEAQLSQGEGVAQECECPTPTATEEVHGTKVKFFGMQCDRKLLGLLGAATDGVLGGSNLIPMKVAPSIDRGADYIISFAIGAAIATLAGWILRFLLASKKNKSFQSGYASLPSMHLCKIFLPGVLSGTLWSIGNIGQIMSVTFLGETIGMSIVQSQMIISGILGIVWFGEVEGKRKILGWVVSAVVTFIGIICLSGEHKS